MMRIGLVAAAVLVAACGSEEDAGELPFEPTLSNIQTEIFDASCAFSTCHSAVGRKGNMSLEAGAAHDNLVGVPVDNPAAAQMGFERVVAGAPADSFLMVKLTKPVATDFGDLMPQGSVDGLTPPEMIDVIEAWIAAGALDD